MNGINLRHSITLGACAALAALIGTVSARAQSSPYKTMKLDNGLEVVAIENHTVPLVTISIAVRNGAFTEPDDYAGLSHLYEHMFFKANAALPSQEQFMKKIRELGIVFNGYTSQEVVVYYFTLPSGNLDAGTQFMANAIKTPLFKDEELVKEREVVLGEFDRNEAQPTFALNYAIDSAMWMPYVSRKQPLGQRQVIKTATTDQMRLIKDLFYLPNNAALIVSGDIKPAVVFDLAKRYLGDWKRGPAPFPAYNAPAFPPMAPKLVIREAKLPDVDVRMHFRAPSVGKDQLTPYAALLLSTLLDQPTTRLYQRLVDSGVITNMRQGYGIGQNVGTYSFYLRTSAEKVAPALAILKQELAAMSRPGYFTDQEIATAKRVVDNERLFEQDNPQSFAIGTSSRWWSMVSLDYYLRLAGNVRNVTPKQVSDYVANWLYKQPMVVGIGADRAALDKINVTQEVLTW